MKTTLLEQEFLHEPTQKEVNDVDDWMCEARYGDSIEADVQSLNYVRNPFLTTIAKLVTIDMPAGTMPLRVPNPSALRGEFEIGGDEYRALNRVYNKHCPAGVRAAIGHQTLSLHMGQSEPQDKELLTVTFERPIDASL